MSDAPGIDVSRIQARILDTLGVPREAPWYVAYSGGVDSTVLLHILSRIARKERVRLIALHADHGLQPRSAAWRRQCEALCREWGIEIRSTTLELPGGDKLGPEGAARAARYRWFRAAAGDGGWLFTAHHRRDQAETVLERLTRGSGPRGLRGIRPRTRLHGLHVVRPLLDTPRRAIEAYAERHRLRWVTDDSNRDAAFTRNYIRSRVLPVLAERWPGIEAALGRSARIMADTQLILDEAAEADLERLDQDRVRGDPCLDIAALKAMAPVRRRNALRHWIHRETGASPGLARLDRIGRAVDRYPADAGGLVWPPVELRPFRGRLYLVRCKRAPGEGSSWDLARDLRVGAGIVLRARPVCGAGLRRDAVAAGVHVAFRRGGEKCRLPGRRHRHTLKQILRDVGVPPWQRPRVPLILVDGEIAAIAGLSCCEPYAAGPGEPGTEIEVVYG